MEKTLIIDGKEVSFKSTGATALRYKAQFGKDYLAEIMKLSNLGKLSKDGKLDPKAIENMDFELFYEIAWTLAKTANNQINDPLTWLDQFETFPLMEIIPDLQDLITSTIQSKKK
jgi:hypothetical protein